LRDPVAERPIRLIDFDKVDKDVLGPQPRRFGKRFDMRAKSAF
jgi:hypothetical protein